MHMTGAWGSFPNSTTTVKMSIEWVLKEKSGDAIRDVQQVNGEQLNETTVEVGACRCTILILESCLVSLVAV